ncbi:unnamed protein product, partial [Amoebophrya sp. A25]|eukprot:GSA25T00022575001.1
MDARKEAFQLGWFQHYGLGVHAAEEAGATEGGKEPQRTAYRDEHAPLRKGMRRGLCDHERDAAKGKNARSEICDLQACGRSQAEARRRRRKNAPCTAIERSCALPSESGIDSCHLGAMRPNRLVEVEPASRTAVGTPERGRLGEWSREGSGMSLVVRPRRKKRRRRDHDSGGGTSARSLLISAQTAPFCSSVFRTSYDSCEQAAHAASSFSHDEAKADVRLSESEQDANSSLSIIIFRLTSSKMITPTAPRSPFARRATQSLVCLLLSLFALPAVAFPTFTSWTIKPNTDPHAGQVFHVEITGTDVDTVNNRVAVMDFTDGSTTCEGANLVADSTVDTLDKVKTTVSCQGTEEHFTAPGGNSAPTRLDCGPFVVYKQTENLGFCVCAATASRPVPSCTSSSDYTYGFAPRFATKGPTGIQIWAAQMKVSTSFTVEGTGLGGSDKVMALEKLYHPTCRNFESTSATGNTMSSHVSNFDGVRDGGSGDTSARWDSVTMNKVAQFIMCWCGGARQDCSDSSQFTTYAGEITVNGPTPSNQERFFVLGSGSNLQVLGVGLRASDRIRIVHNTNVQCGNSGAGSNIGAVDRGADGLPAFVDSSVSPAIAQWADVSITTAGTYKVCWCGMMAVDPDGCTSDAHFNVDAGTIVVSGPDQGGTFNPILGEKFSVAVTGQGMHAGDRVILSEQSCGNVA